jgi:uncharacterized damage-inducible protein DinB
MLPDAPSICRLHLDFMKWADGLMLQMVRGVDPAVVERKEGVSFESILGTVQHIYRGERVWYRRVTGEPTLPISDIETPSLEELTERWPVHHDEWRHWAAELNHDAWFKSILIRNSAGLELPSPYWQIVLHLVNHGTYHRGQVLSLVKQAGFPLVSTDLIAWYRSLAAKPL